MITERDYMDDKKYTEVLPKHRDVIRQVGQTLYESGIEFGDVTKSPLGDKYILICHGAYRKESPTMKLSWLSTRLSNLNLGEIVESRKDPQDSQLGQRKYQTPEGIELHLWLTKN